MRGPPRDRCEKSTMVETCHPDYSRQPEGKAMVEKYRLYKI